MDPTKQQPPPPYPTQAGSGGFIAPPPYPPEASSYKPPDAQPASGYSTQQVSTSIFNFWSILKIIQLPLDSTVFNMS